MARESDFVGYTKYQPSFLRMYARILPLALAFFVLVICSFAIAAKLLDPYIAAYGMLAAIPILVFAVVRGRNRQCPKCGGNFLKYSDEEAKVGISYGYIFVCYNCKHFFKERHDGGV